MAPFADSPSPTERRLADAIAGVAERVTGRSPEAVEVHFREQTVVLLLECDGVPREGSPQSAEVRRAIAAAVEDALGRPVGSWRALSRPSEDSVLSLLRVVGSPPVGDGVTGAGAPAPRAG